MVLKKQCEDVVVDFGYKDAIRRLIVTDFKKNVLRSRSSRIIPSQYWILSCYCYGRKEAFRIRNMFINVSFTWVTQNASLH